MKAKKTPERGNFGLAYFTAGRMYIIETETHPGTGPRYPESLALGLAS
jgi:hypothetical protein